MTRLHLRLSSTLMAVAFLCAACGSSGGTSVNTSGNGAAPVPVPSIAVTTTSPTPAPAAGNSLSGSVALLDRTAHATITVALYEQLKSQPFAMQTVDTQGTYAFPGLADGSYRVLILGTGYRTQTDFVTLANRTSLTKNYMLSSTDGSLNGAETRGLMNQHQGITHLLSSLHGFPVAALQIKQLNARNSQARKGTFGAIHPYTVAGASSVAIDANNNVWVSANVQAGSSANGVVQLDGKGNILQSGPTDPNSNNSGGGPIAVDPSINVALSNLSRTTAIIPQGKLASLSTVNDPSGNQGALFPGAIKAQGSRFIATIPLAQSQVQVLTPSGYTPVSATLPANMFLTGRCLAIDPKDNSIYVAGSVLSPPPAQFAQAATLVHLDASGSTVLETVTLGANPTAANFNPQGLVINSQGTLFLGATAQALPGLVQVSGPVGNRTVTAITTTHKDGTVFRPTALALDSQDNLWALDSNGGLATRFDSAAANPTDVSVGQFPNDIAIDGLGNAWVTVSSPSNTGQVVEIDGQPVITNATTQLADGSTQTFTGGTVANQNTSTFVHTIPSSNVGSVANFGPTTPQTGGPSFINFVGQNPFGATIQAGNMTFPAGGGVDYTFGALPGAYDPMTPITSNPVITTPPVITSQTTPVVVSQTAPVVVSQTAPVIVTSSTKVDGSQTFDVNIQNSGYHVTGAFGPYQADGSQTVDLLLVDRLEAQYPDSAQRYHITGTFNQKGEAALKIELTGGRLPSGAPNPGLSFTAIITTTGNNQYHETIINTLGSTGIQETSTGGGFGFEQVFLNTFLGDLTVQNLALFNFQAPVQNTGGASGFEITSSGGDCGPGFNPLQLGSPIPVSSFNPVTAQVETVSTSNICTTGFHQVGGDGGAGSGPTVVDNGDSFGYSGGAPDPGGYGGGGIPGL